MSAATAVRCSNPSATTASRAAGFTLIEVLLAIAITSAVMLAVGTTFHVTLDARDLVDELSESTAAGPRILNLIERDLRGLWTYNVKQNRVLVGRSRDVGSIEADRIDMLTTTDSVGYVLDDRNVGHRTTLCEVGYWLKPNIRDRNRIELWRREDPMLDDDLTTQGRFQLVHDWIKSFKVTYYRELGHNSVELHEWDSGVEDTLPRRIKIEFTLERNRQSRNIVDDAEIEDFEGAEKTYVRHIVLDPRLMDVLQPDVAMLPVRPGRPQAGEGSGGGGGADLSMTQGRGGPGPGEREIGRTGSTVMTAGQGPGGGRGAPSAAPPGFNLGDLLRNTRGGGGLFGGGGSNGQTGGGGRGR